MKKLVIAAIVLGWASLFMTSCEPEVVTPVDDNSTIDSTLFGDDTNPYDSSDVNTDTPDDDPNFPGDSTYYNDDPNCDGDSTYYGDDVPDFGDSLDFGCGNPFGGDTVYGGN